MKSMLLPDFVSEQEVADYMVIGVDEVGRGAIAGPVVAGAVCLSGDQKFWLGLGINDSKRLTPTKREKLAEIVKQHGVWGMGVVSVAYINSHGIVKATEKAMRAAIKEARTKSSAVRKTFVLLDAFNVRYIPGCGFKQQKAIIKGDQKSISIAAASIIAKVYRDSLMKELHKKFPEYEFDLNKGYGTKKHLEAIKKHSVKMIHRKWNFG